ncbi:UPF0561 protein C2orf68 homolog [Haliotis cracherodii]|uniref:UPF0561 protein C2orf68 homolog n=1 Tax=Haliotis cracherodii TaxID=6455 RepID=UPI0039E8388A
MSSTNRKLDMRHGFMKSIIRNQLDRDNYDKEVREKVSVQDRGKHTDRNKKTRPDARAYVPPFSRRRRGRQEKQDTFYMDDREDREELFMLEYEDRDGHIHKRKIYSTDSPDDVARKLGQERHLSAPYIDALAQRLSEEMEKRHGSGNSSET